MKNYHDYIANHLRGIYPDSEINALVRLLIREVSGRHPSVFFSDKSNQLNELQEARLDDILRRLQKSEPLQYVLGQAEFFGLTFEVDSRVLIPRPETEELVEWILEDTTQDTGRILDVGTGSGCIAVSLAVNLPKAEAHAWDISSEALAVASGNARRNNVQLSLTQKDILSVEADSGQVFDVIVSNPPYISSYEKKDMHANVLDYEPHIALFVEDRDPLLFYRSIALFALNALRSPGGCLYFEISSERGPATVDLLHELGFGDVELRKDISGNDRMIRARR